MTPASQVMSQRGRREAAVIEIIAIDTPTLGDRSYLAHDGSAAFVIDPQRDIDRVLDLAGDCGVTITHVFETHLHNDYVTGGLALARGHRRRLPRQRRRHGGLRPGPGLRRGRHRGQPVRCGCGCWPRPATPSPTCPTCWRPPGSRRRCSPAGRCCTAPPGGPTCSARHTPRRWPTPSTPRRSRLAAELPEDAGGLSHARLRQLLLGHPVRGRRPRPSAAERQFNPALTLGEKEYVETLLAGLDAYPAYYAHMGPANAAGPARRGPVRAQPRGRRGTAAAHPGRGMGGGPAHPHRVRGRAPRRHAQLRAGRQLRHLPGLADPLGHPADPARRNPAGRSPTPSGNWRGSASTGRPRRLPAAPAEWAGGQPLRSFPVADFADLAAVRHHRPVVAAGRAPEPGMGRVAPRRRRAHPAARPAGPPRRGARRARSGCTAAADTGPRSPPPFSTPRAARSSPSTTSSTTRPAPASRLAGRRTGAAA